MSWNYSEAVDKFSFENLERYKEQLINLVKIRSISPGVTDKTEFFNILQAIGEITASLGFENRIIETKGNPVFIAQLERDPNLPWVTIYNHMDVQPADEPQWITEPFEPVVTDEKIIARGSTDDKGPALSILYGIKFLLDNNIPSPNLQIVYETEEETGSPFFGQFLDDNPEALKKPYSILVSDTVFEGDRPAITYKLKGMLRVEVGLKTGNKDLHSGMFGNGVVNPLNTLIQALSRCADSKGNVLIPGFFDGCPEMNEDEQKRLRAVADQFDLEKFKQDSADATLHTEDGFKILKRLWHLPTFEVHGFEGAQYEPGAMKSAIPYDVKAKVSMRLVPGQEPQHLVNCLQSFLRQVHPDIEVTSLGGQNAVLADLNHPHMELAREACRQGYRSDPLFVGCGGTIGSLPQFQRVYPGVPIVLIAQSLMSDGYHAPNEEFRWEQGRRGMQVMACYLNLLNSVG